MRDLLLLGLIALLQTLAFAQNNSNQEVLSLRDMYSKTFQLASGEYQAVLNGSPIHYYNGMSWENIDDKLVVNGNSLMNVTNVIESEFPIQSSSNSFISYSINQHEILLSTQKELVYFENGVHSVMNISNWGNAQYHDNSVSYVDATSGIQDVYTVFNGEIKNDLVLNDPNGLENVTNSVYVGFREVMSLPQGWELRAAVLEQSPTLNQGVLIVDEFDEVQLMIPAPMVYDASGMENNGANANDAAFVIEEENGQWMISTLVPASWLNAPERIYPITFDPSVTFTGNTGGWQSQNNFVDNPGFVFIGVCCGNLEHRAWLKWSVSSIPANSCVTIAELQVYVNGVGASTAELVHAFDMMATTTLGIFGPYGAINTPVYNDQGNGYYTSFTLMGTGYYGWYDLGANAYADIMTMANTYGWYQLALIFDNEPSTNWKRLTAGLCSLRITYQPPPCTVLPIELSHFNATCDDGNAVLSWTTESEINNDHFTIARSTDGVNFSDLVELPGAGISHETTKYAWTDNNRYDQEVYYRLSQTDFNGVKEYFDPIAFGGCQRNQPNILTEQFDVIVVEGEEIKEIHVFDEFGREVAFVENQKDAQIIQVNPEVNQGFYLVRVLNQDGQTFTQKVYLEK